MVAVKFVDFQGEAFEDFVSKLENDSYSIQNLSEEGVDAFIDAQLLDDETKFYLDFIYQSEDLLTEDKLQLTDLSVNVNEKFVESIPVMRRAKWKKIKEKIRKIVCELVKALGGQANIKDLITKTLEKLKDNILGGVPALLSVIIVGFVTFFIKKAMGRICPD